MAKNKVYFGTYFLPRETEPRTIVVVDKSKADAEAFIQTDIEGAHVITLKRVKTKKPKILQTPHDETPSSTLREKETPTVNLG